MVSHLIKGLVLFSCFLTFQAQAFSELKCYTFTGCPGGGRSTSTSSNPSYGNQIRLNPSAVPTEEGLGLETILYSGEADFALVKGLGRVGAAVSPSNSEETFFGPPGVETSQDYLDRKREGKKYPNQKITLATAFDLVKPKQNGLQSYSLQMGVMGRYNRKTYNVNPGGGLSGTLGPISFGASIYKDETQVDMTSVGSVDHPVIAFDVATYNFGVSLGSLLVDYSVLRMEETESKTTSTVRLITGSLMVKKVILTVSKRTEDSDRDAYNFETKLLTPKKIKEDFFGGIQINATKHLMLGILYNYYQFHEYSLTATLFF